MLRKNFFKSSYNFKQINIIYFALEEHNNKNANGADKKATDTDQLVSETVDQSLQTYDEDNDGYINYGEFYR